MRESDFRNIVEEQRSWCHERNGELPREALPALKPLPSHALIVCGVRRCGKSTLLRQYLRSREKEVLQIRFEDYRLSGFQMEDFAHVEALLRENHKRILLVDEIQNVEGWEVYVRQKLEDGVSVYITGSNATLLSQELGTRLTGRHLRYELTPFSFSEACSFRAHEHSCEAFQNYLREGGFPEYLTSGDSRVLNELVGDILVRDIAVRVGIRDVHALKMLCDYLLQNVGNLVSPSRLTGLLSIRSPRTILDYCGFLEDSYLVHFVPLHAYSRKAQELAPKKIYAVDNGLCRVRMNPDKDDVGHLLENAVYQHLRRSGGEITYFRNQDHECDFIVTAPDGSKQAIQVCWKLTADNREREEQGLLAAMKAFSLKEGTLITLDEKDHVRTADGWIHVQPAWTWM